MTAVVRRAAVAAGYPTVLSYDVDSRDFVRGSARRALEGDFGSRVVLLELPSYEDALGFYRALNTTRTPVQQPPDHR